MRGGWTNRSERRTRVEEWERDERTKSESGRSGTNESDKSETNESGYWEEDTVREIKKSELCFVGDCALGPIILCKMLWTFGLIYGDKLMCYHIISMFTMIASVINYVIINLNLSLVDCFCGSENELRPPWPRCIEMHALDAGTEILIYDNGGCWRLCPRANHFMYMFWTYWLIYSW